MLLMESPSQFLRILYIKHIPLLLFLITMLQIQHRALVQGLAMPLQTNNRLVLIGGGHAHAQVIKALKIRPQNLHVTVIDIAKSVSYSGMVPGCVAGLYTPEQTLLHLEPLCEWADIEFIQDEVVDMDLENNSISLRHTPDPVLFDAVSLDIGSKSRGLDDIPGAREHTIPTRPISKLVQRIADAEKNLGQKSRVVVVGGGAAGIELAMSMRGRWGPLLGDNLQVTLLDAGDELLPNEAPACRQALQNVLKNRGIEVLHQCQVKEVTASNVLLDGGVSIPHTQCIWAAGAAAPSLAHKLQSRGLAVSDRGWIRVNDNLQSLSHPNIFAAGDCCTIEGLPGGRSSPPKAGVYAVRSGPVLIENLPGFLQSKPLLPYNPQDDFLKLLACGDGKALGFRFGLPLQGKWVFEMKDHIDQMFMNLFKKENLPDLIGEDSDTSQFDAIGDNDGRVQLSPEEAASLLQRTDDSVNYMTAWHVIRDMTQDEEYRGAVMGSMGQAVIAQ